MFNFGEKKKLKKSAKAKREEKMNSMMLYVLTEMADGKRIEDIVMYHLDDPIEWDPKRAVWTVTSSIALGNRQWVLLTHSRGGAGTEEEGWVYNPRYLVEKEVYVYDIDFTQEP